MRSRAGGDGLLRALGVHLLADRLLHPHAGAAGAAAHAPGAVARHLDDVDAGERADHLARREVHVVVAAEVAGVVVRDALGERRARHRQAPVGDQLHQELRVVDHLVVAVELRVLVLQRVEAVRALRDDLLHAEAVERLDVLHREHLEDVLVARAPGAVAGAHLARAEDREVDAGPLEQLGHRAARLLVPVVERSRAARPSRGTRGRSRHRARRSRRPRASRPSRRARPGSCRRRSRCSPSSGTRCRGSPGSCSP